MVFETQKGRKNNCNLEWINVSVGNITAESNNAIFHLVH